ncbi:MAG: hypothetical protein ABI569_08050 [Casimicrobiaceae bacterium]
MSTGVWIQGFIAITLRNTMISRHSTAVQFDGNLANANGALDIVNSDFTQNSAGVYYAATATGGTNQLRIVDTQITSTTNDAINVANSASNRNTFLTMSRTTLGQAANGIVMANSAVDIVNARVILEMDNSQVIGTNFGIDLNSPNGAKTHALIRESTLAHDNTVLRTRGTARVSASLIRSEINNCGTVVDHGIGTIRLESNHIVLCSDDFVNNGSAAIVSDGKNIVHDVDNLSGFTYITPTPISVK